MRCQLTDFFLFRNRWVGTLLAVRIVNFGAPLKFKKCELSTALVNP